MEKIGSKWKMSQIWPFRPLKMTFRMIQTNPYCYSVNPNHNIYTVIITFLCKWTPNKKLSHLIFIHLHVKLFNERLNSFVVEMKWFLGLFVHIVLAKLGQADARTMLVCWSLTSLCHSNGHIESMPAREFNPFTALTRIRSQFLRTQWSTSNHQRVDMTTPHTAKPSGLAARTMWN